MQHLGGFTSDHHYLLQPWNTFLTTVSGNTRYGSLHSFLCTLHLTKLRGQFLSTCQLSCFNVQMLLHHRIVCHQTESRP